MIPDHLSAFFWDIDTGKFDPGAHPRYTIARLLEYGDMKAIAWLRAHFSEETIKEVVNSERTLSPRSAGFWALVYNIPSEEVAALKNQAA